MKREKESRVSFRKKKKAREEELKKNEGAILKFVNISLQSSLSSANERDEFSSFSKSLPHTETEKTVDNQEVIIESIPTNKTLKRCGYLARSDNMRVEMVKAGPERYQNKEGPFKPAIRVIKEGDKEKESLSFWSKKWFYKTLKNGDKVLRSWLHSVVEVIKFLCKQNLPLHGHSEDSNSRNQENFLKTLKLLAKYNAVI